VNLSRILVVALAVAAIVAPTAAAKPMDWHPGTGTEAAVPDMRASVAQALAKERKAQRSLPGPVGPPTWPTNPTPLKPPATAPQAASQTGGDGFDWWLIGIGAGVTLVALGAMAGVTYLVRAKQRPRVA
jgi:hypothetical protein